MMPTKQSCKLEHLMREDFIYKAWTFLWSTIALNDLFYSNLPELSELSVDSWDESQRQEM